MYCVDFIVPCPESFSFTLKETLRAVPRDLIIPVAPVAQCGVVLKLEARWGDMVCVDRVDHPHQRREVCAPEIILKKKDAY
jgi:hypothetical protein